jgi:transposase InsO family protein
MKAQHPVAQLCAALDVTRSGYHAWKAAPPSARAAADAALLADIRQIHTRHRGRYGAPRIQQELHQRQQRHGTKRIARLMRAGGLRGRPPRRFVPRTTDSDHDRPLAPNHLAGRAAPTGPNQVRVSDLTCVKTAEGWL